MVLWHLAATTFVFRWVFRDPHVDLRYLWVGAVAPDLVDVPLAVALGFPGGAHRLWGHTLLAASTVMVVVLLTRRRGRPRKPWMALTVGVFLHLTFDGMWTLPETLFWPFFGTSFASTGVAGPADLMRIGWWGIAAEVLGAAYLARMWWSADLDDRHRFASTGVLRPVA